MRAQTIVSPMPSFRELLPAFFKDRQMILRSMGFTFAAMFLVALLMHSKYAATTSLVVTLGPEYTFRPEAGATSMVNSTIDREQMLRTEIEILQSPALQEDVIRAVGLERLYPNYVDKGPIGLLVDGVKHVVVSTVRGVRSM